MKTGLKLAILAVLVILAGLQRENIFVRIGSHEAYLRGSTDFVPGQHWLYGFLHHLSIGQLSLCRYLFTLLFILVFYLLSRLLVSWFFYSPAHVRLVNLVFICVLAFAVLVYGLGYITGIYGDFYSISRYALGLVETPLVLLVLVPVLWTSRRMAQ